MIKRIFDIGFQHQLNNRFQSFEHLNELMAKVMSAGEEETFNYENFLQSSVNEVMLQLEQSLKKMEPAFKSIFQQIPSIISTRFADIEVGMSGPSVLPHWTPMCIVGHLTLTEKYKREIQRTYMVKLYPNGSEYILSLFPDKEEEIVIERFDDIRSLDEMATRKGLLEHIMRNFAILKREMSGQ